MLILDDQLMVIAQALIARIDNEMNRTAAADQNSSHFTQKCINILKQITQNKTIMMSYSQLYE